MVQRELPRSSRGRTRGSEGGKASASLLRAGRVPLLQGADADELHPAAHRQQDAPPLRRDRAQYLGRPRADLARRQGDSRKRFRAANARSVHSDNSFPGRKRRHRRPPQRLLSPAPLRGGARLRRGSHGRKAVLRRLYEDRGEGGGERKTARGTVLHAAALRPAAKVRLEAARCRFRDPLLRGLRRAARRGFHSS